MSEVKSVEWNFRELVENSDDIFIVVDRNYKIRYISSSVSKLYGTQPIALLGKDIFSYVSPDKLEECRKYFSDSGNGQSYEIGLELRKGFKTYFDVHITQAHQQGAMPGFLLKLHNITKKKNKEKELMDTNKQLDQVIYKTTHDLKAPILSALGLINLAEKSPADQRQEYLSLIKRSLLKLNAFIEEMNNFFRNEKMALQREKIEIGMLIHEEIHDLRNLYNADKIRIEIKVDEGTEFFSDVVRVKTIITNILTNAIKYTDPKKPNPFIQVKAKVKADFCEISISDNGIGIDQEHVEKIFDLFHRATSVSHGTGIGLFIVKDTIERLSGIIHVKSKIEEGTTFIMQIPNQLYQPVGLN
jgi:PAS domain S-box-containing protein